MAPQLVDASTNTTTTTVYGAPGIRLKYIDKMMAGVTIAFVER